MRLSRRYFLLGLTTTTAGVVGVASIKLLQSQPVASSNSLTTTQAYAALREGQIILIDIRRPEEWRATGIAQGAIPIDMRREDFIEAVRIAATDPSVPIALICAGGVRSRRIFDTLEDAGVTNIIDVPEGMSGSRAGPGWIAAGLPVVGWSGQP